MASYPPKKGVAFTIYLPILDADGDLVASAAALSSTLSGDGAAFGAGATPTDEGEGFYSIVLTTAQMNFDNISGVLKTTTSGAKNTPFSIYTVTRQIDDLAFPTVSGRGTDVSAAGEVGIDWANIGGPTSAAVLSGTTIGTLTTYTGNTVQTGDAFARLGAPAGASVSADIAIIEGQTDDIGAAGAGLTAIPWNATWDAEVQSEVADALDVAIPGTPTADSINQRIRSMDLLTEAAGAGDLAAILVDTAVIGAAGAGLTAIPWNAAWDAEVESEVDDALGAGTGTALTAIPWNAAWDTEVQSEVTDALTVALTEGYATDGSTASVAQLLYMIWSALAEFAISSTTITAKKLDGSTTAMTFTLDDATNPTSRTRAT